MLFDDEFGPYSWMEMKVNDTKQRAQCFYGLQDSDKTDGRAERLCMANLIWSDIDGSACASKDTAALRNLAVTY